MHFAGTWSTLELGALGFCGAFMFFLFSFILICFFYCNCWGVFCGCWLPLWVVHVLLCTWTPRGLSPIVGWDPLECCLVAFFIRCSLYHGEAGVMTGGIVYVVWNRVWREWCPKTLESLCLQVELQVARFPCINPLFCGPALCWTSKRNKRNFVYHRWLEAQGKLEVNGWCRPSRNRHGVF